MPLDPNIPLGVQPPKFNSPFEILGQLQQLQAQRQVIQSNQALEEQRRAQVAAQERLQKQQQTIDELMQTSLKPDADTGVYTFDRPTFEQGLMRSGNGHLYPALAEHLNALDKSTQEMHDKRNTAFARSLVALGDAGYTEPAALGTIAYLKKNQMMTDAQAAQVLQQISANPTPEGIKATVQQFGAAIPQYGELTRAAEKSQADLAHVKAQTEAAKRIKASPDEIIYDEYGGELARGKEKEPTPKAYQHVDKLLDGKPATLLIDPAPGGKTYDLSGNAIENAAARVRPIPPASIQINNQNKADAAAVTELKPGTRDYKVAQDLASGALTYSQMLRMYPSRSGAMAAIKASIYEKARDLNPDFTPAAFEAGYKFATNPKTVTAIAAVDNVLPNIEKIIELSNSWDRSRFPDLNKYLGTAQLKLGNTTVANIRQAQKLIGDELGVALGAGAMTDMKLQLGLDVVDPNLAPDVFLSNMERVREFLRNRKQSLQTPMGVYGNQNQPPKDETKPDAAALLKKYGG